MNNLSLLDTVSLIYSIQCISGALLVTNNTYITNQRTFTNSYLSTVSIVNSTIHDILSDYIILAILSTNLTINGLIVTNLHTATVGKF